MLTKDFGQGLRRTRWHVAAISVRFCPTFSIHGHVPHVSTWGMAMPTRTSPKVVPEPSGVGPYPCSGGTATSLNVHVVGVGYAWNSSLESCPSQNSSSSKSSKPVAGLASHSSTRCLFEAFHVGGESTNPVASSGSGMRIRKLDLLAWFSRGLTAGTPPSTNSLARDVIACTPLVRV